MQRFTMRFGRRRHLCWWLRGASDQELGLDRLRAGAERTLGDEPKPWYWSYRVRVAVK
jgi:hypothetical protein